jgi:hypothetical protein
MQYFYIISDYELSQSALSIRLPNILNNKPGYTFLVTDRNLDLVSVPIRITTTLFSYLVQA